MTRKPKILFVCTGNRFRSLAAERFFSLFDEDNEFEVVSSGTVGKPHEINETVLKSLADHGTDTEGHKIKPVTKELVYSSDVIICMNENHKEFIENNYDVTCFLFKEMVGDKGGVLDWHEKLKDADVESESAKKYIKNTTHYLFKKTPALFKFLHRRFYLFTEFLKGERHANNAKFEVLKETKHSVLFTPIHNEITSDFQLLAIPKKRHIYLHEIPANELTDLLELVQQAGKLIKKKYGGYNIWQNNGWDADQQFYHVHFHIIPRKFSDEVQVVSGNWKVYNLAEYEEMTKKARELLNEIK